MATGLGAFIGGFAKGAADVQEMEARKQAIERDKERMALEKDRFSLEKARSEREAAMGEIAQKQAQIELEKAKRDEEFQNDQKTAYKDFQRLAQAGYEAEEITQDGKPVAVRRFQDGPAAIAEAKARGNQFRPGSLKRVGELDSTDKALLFRDMYNNNLIKHGRMTPEVAFAAREQDRKLQSEGALDALRYFETTGDVAGAKKMFNTKGGIKIGDDVMLKLVPEEITGGFKTIGTRMVNGKEEVVFDSFQNVILPSMGAQEYTRFIAENRKLGITEKGANTRQEKQIVSTENIAEKDRKNRMDLKVLEEMAANYRAKLKDTEGKDRVGEGLLKILYPLPEKLASNPSFQADPVAYQQVVTKQLAAARALIDSGQVRTLEDAAAQAVKKYPLPAAR